MLVKSEQKAKSEESLWQMKQKACSGMRSDQGADWSPIYLNFGQRRNKRHEKQSRVELEQTRWSWGHSKWRLTVWRTAGSPAYSVAMLLFIDKRPINWFQEGNDWAQLTSHQVKLTRISFSSFSGENGSPYQVIWTETNVSMSCCDEMTFEDV